MSKFGRSRVVRKRDRTDALPPYLQPLRGCRRVRFAPELRRAADIVRDLNH